LLERWRERPELPRMQALAAEEMLGHDVASATLELVSAIETLAMEPTYRRYDELKDKGELTKDEETEFRELLVIISRSKSRGIAQGTPGGSG
jgi:hypothetical protein